MDVLRERILNMLILNTIYSIDCIRLNVSNNIEFNKYFQGILTLNVLKNIIPYSTNDYQKKSIPFLSNKIKNQ